MTQKEVQILDIVAYNKQLCQAYKKNKSIELLEKYVVSETIPPIADYGNAVKIIRSSYSCQVNSTLLIIGAYLTSGWVSGDNELLEILNKMYEHLPLKEQSIICFLNAHHLRFRDDNYIKSHAYQKYLLDSLKNGVSFVKNRVYLAELYTKNDAKKMYQKAITNIIKVHSAEEIAQMPVEQFVEPQNFINEHILGTHITYLNYETLIEKSNAV